MAISQTVLILAGGTAALSIVFGIRLAMRAMAGSAAAAPRSDGGETSAAGGSGAPDIAGVIALPPLIFLGFLVAAAVVEAVVPFPVLAAHAFPRYLAGTALAAAGFVMIVMGTRRFQAAGTNIPPNLPTTALVVDGIYSILACRQLARRWIESTRRVWSCTNSLRRRHLLCFIRWFFKRSRV